MSYNSKYKSSEIEAILDSVEGKQDAIADLDAIRSGAEKGATALQSIPSEYVTENELTAKGYATTSALNDKVDKVSGKQLSTEDFTSALKTKLEGLSNYDDTEIENAISSLQTQFNTLVSGDASDAINSFNEIMAFLDGIKDTQDLASIIASIEQQIAGKYTKPSGGIPASDLAPDVFLQGEKGDKGDKGDTGATGPQGPQGVSVTSVVQTTTSSADGGSNVMTVTLSNGTTSTFNVKNGSKGSNGTNGTNGTNGATFTPSVDSAGNLSWTNNGGLTNPPTVNIKGPKGDKGEAGSGGSGGGSGAYAEVNHGTSDTTFALTPNTLHVWDEVASLTLTLGSETSGVANEFVFQFTSGATATVLTLPDDIKWTEELTIESNRIYQISILKGLASVLSWENANTSALIENHITYDGGDFMNGGTITFEYPTASELTFSMDYYSSGTLIVPQGSTQVNVEWYEPSAPIISGFSPEEDSTYKYVLS